MSEETHPDDSILQRLWDEYGQYIRGYDDLSLVRWMSQTLGQLEGRVWRLSHPLVGTYRLAAIESNKRGLWQKRLVPPPSAYPQAACCPAPLLPLITRDIAVSGMICEHCGGTAVAFGDIPEPLRGRLTAWAEQYSVIHDVAHWDEARKKAEGEYQATFDQAAERAEAMLIELATEILPPMLDEYPAIIWEDHDECLDVRAEDLDLGE